MENRNTEVRSQKSEVSNFEIRDELTETLTTLKGMFGACCYLMGGHKQRLEGEDADFELWFADIRNRLDEAIEAVGEIR